MASPPRGTIQLNCRALLEHPWRDRHSHIAVIFDVIIHGLRIANGSPILCGSFRYVKQEAGENVDTGIYDIVVRVRFTFASSIPVSTDQSQRLLLSNLENMKPVRHARQENFHFWVT